MTLDEMTSDLSRVADSAHEARTWLLEAAAPMWSQTGRTKSGLFAERIALTGEPDASYFRTFVQARHIFSFATIGKMGWHGPWKELIAETTERLICCAKRADGLFVHLLDAQCRWLDDRADLYDQAFILFALGTAGGALGRDDLFDEAERLLDRLETAWNHPAGGFREGEIADSIVRRQNPHMHLLEAFLALHETSRRPRFMQAARSLAELASTKFIDGSSGALLEYFTDELEPAVGIDGRIAEPGHCFEWAWLFERLARAGWTTGLGLSDQLTAFARCCGIDEVRGVAVNEVLAEGSVHDADARLWPQTERLKAALARFGRLGWHAEAHEAMNAARGLGKFLNVRTPGLWRDKQKKDGSWIEEMAPGSSLYHISCAYAEMTAIAQPT